MTGAKQAVVADFLARFTLTETETQAIASRDVDVGQPLFNAMDRIERIREDSRQLMVGEEGQTKAGYMLFNSSKYTVLMPTEID